MRDERIAVRFMLSNVYPIHMDRAGNTEGKLCEGAMFREAWHRTDSSRDASTTRGYESDALSLDGRKKRVKVRWLCPERQGAERAPQPQRAGSENKNREAEKERSSEQH